MRERIVLIVTPVVVSDEHPTGKPVYETAAFRNSTGFERAIREMVERHMRGAISLLGIFAW